jgi:hypothetical protein
VIDHIYIQDYDEHYAPPEKPELEVALSGDIVFLAIGKTKQTDKVREFTPDDGKQIGVPAVDLVNAIKILVKSTQREDLKRELGSDTKLRATSV